MAMKKTAGIGRKIRRGDLYNADCPSRSVLDHVTSRWGSLVLILLLKGTHRFSELARGIGGVSEKMLAQSLQALEADGFVLRRSTLRSRLKSSTASRLQGLSAHKEYTL